MQQVHCFIKVYFFIFMTSLAVPVWGSQVPEKLTGENCYVIKKFAQDLADDTQQRAERGEFFKREMLLADMEKFKKTLQAIVSNLENEQATLQEINDAADYALFGARSALSLSSTCTNKTQQGKLIRQTEEYLALASQLQNKFSEQNH